MPNIAGEKQCERCPHPLLCLDPQDTPGQADKRIRVARNQALYRVGDATGHRIYSIRAGSFKLQGPVPYRAAPQVIDFLLAPDVLGLNEIGIERHACSAIALEESVVCCIRWDRGGAARGQPQRRAAQHALLAADLRRQQRTLLTLQAIRADKRLAALLLQLSQVHHGNGCSASRFHLPLSRNDIAGYLSVTPEFVGRLFDQLAREGLLTRDRRDITLHCLTGIAKLAGGRAART